MQNTVEQSFRDLKDVIDMRPIYHKNDDSVEAHILVASLALFLKRVLEYQLSSKLPELSGTDALAAMRSVGITELDLDGQVVRLVSGGGLMPDGFWVLWGLNRSIRWTLVKSLLEGQKCRHSDKFKIESLSYKDLQTQLTNMR